VRVFALITVMLVTAPRAALAQGGPPARPPTPPVARPAPPPPARQPSAQQPSRRRTLEIRGQAPAPEVVTVRPREVPAYTRRIIVPALFEPPPPTRGTVVLLPGPLPEPRAPGTPDPPGTLEPPGTPNPPHRPE